VPPSALGASPVSEHERSRGECQRLAAQIDALSDTVAALHGAAKALRAENLDLRAEAARLRGHRRPPDRADSAELADLTIPLSLQAPSVARAFIVRCLADHVASETLEDAQLLVTELVTNSVRHSGTTEGDDIVVRVHLWRQMCRLEVEDHGRDAVIAPQPLDPMAGSGIGLNLVQMLSQRWGVIQPPNGPTRVWAQLPCDRDHA
jgi:anti-sigma regulatory factor (Ser/Thr protein kinase)